ncbi:NTP transferase domain-containing protein [Longimicrobium sp.]|uniref:NTP transferase domain-containing protein n=1 Tax=Longimicrobium sp. TaxID=2029185 RepID=UPI003B3AB535
MAAGAGRRLARLSRCKPLTMVAGKPLIDHVFSQCSDAGIEEVFIAIRAGETELEQYIRKEVRFPGGVRIVRVPPDGGTGASLHALVQEIGNAACLISTADTVASQGTYERLLRFVGSTAPTTAVVLATTYVSDDDPIWVVSTPDGRLLRIAKGIPPTSMVFANVRWLSAQACEYIGGLTVLHQERDMSIMAALLRQPDSDVRIYVETPVFDVDDPSDVEAAALFLKGQMSA